MSTNPSAMPEKTRTEDLPLISVIVPVYELSAILTVVYSQSSTRRIEIWKSFWSMMALRTLA